MPPPDPGERWKPFQTHNFLPTRFFCQSEAETRRRIHASSAFGGGGILLSAYPDVIVPEIAVHRRRRAATSAPCGRYLHLVEPTTREAEWNRRGPTKLN